MLIYIKNMVCNRCISVVKNILEDLKLTPLSIQLGEVNIQEDLNNEQKKNLQEKLENQGFELLDDFQQKIIEKIKSLVISKIQNQENENLNYSELISKNLNKDYSSLSKLFSTTEGITIEQYIILQKIEKVKELITYNEMNLSEISFSLGYSSVAHLSSQFKKITGLTPSQFKAQGIKLRKPLDKV